MKAEMAGRRTIKAISEVVNFAVLTAIVLLLAYAGYSLWDSQQIYRAAEKSNYAIYKPTAENEGKTFKELQAINPEVIAWLSVYGTNIDYPVTQGEDNQKYINTDAEGRHSLSGALFLDSNNRKDFSDFNNIVYGHHMEKQAMFGEIGSFTDKNMFDTHRYGNLYVDGKNYGIEFFAFVHADAYDSMVFSPNVEGEARQAYLDGLLEKAKHKRAVPISTDDRIVLLSTCSSYSTNGRDILLGKITDKTYSDPYFAEDIKSPKTGIAIGGNNGFLHNIELHPAAIVFAAAMMMIARLVAYIYRSIQQKLRVKRIET